MWELNVFQWWVLAWFGGGGAAKVTWPTGVTVVKVGGRGSGNRHRDMLLVSGPES